MSLLRINTDPSRRHLIVFGVVWLAFFTVIGSAMLARGMSVVAAALGAAALVVPALGLVSARFLRAVYVAMAYATYPVGVVLSYVLLAIVYYLVVTPMGILMRAFGHDPLKRRDAARAESYWVPRETGTDLKRYFRQF